MTTGTHWSALGRPRSRCAAYAGTRRLWLCVLPGPVLRTLDRGAGRVAGEHENWDDYRAAMRGERRVLLRMALDRAGPDRAGYHTVSGKAPLLGQAEHVGVALTREPYRGPSAHRGGTRRFAASGMLGAAEVSTEAAGRSDADRTVQ
jgi:hypothetical protein